MNVEVRQTESAVEKAVAEQFEKRAEALPGTDWVRELRSGAFARFAEKGLPHRRIEEWKYTDLRTLLRDLPPPASGGAAGISPDTLGDIDAHRVTIVDGGQPELPKAVEGVEIESFETALAGGDPAFADLLASWPRGSDSPVLDLNTAFMNTGVVIRVKAGVQLDRPLHVTHVTRATEPSAVYARSVVILEDGAKATFIESYEGPDGVAYHVNAATRFQAGDKTDFTHIKVQREGDSAIHLATLGGAVGAEAKLTLVPFTIGAALSRTNIAWRFDGADAVGNIAGVQILGGRQHADTTLFVDHREPNCGSRELMKNVLDDRARGVFQGMILVRKDAQETDGKMMSQALMLSDGAEMDNKPELEIYADNVACGHGATTGNIDEDLLFYLRSRGIPEVQAQALLIEAFIAEAVEAIENEQIREALSGYAHDWVARRKGQET